MAHALCFLLMRLLYKCFGLQLPPVKFHQIEGQSGNLCTTQLNLVEMLKSFQPQTRNPNSRKNCLSPSGCGCIVYTAAQHKHASSVQDESGHTTFTAVTVHHVYSHDSHITADIVIPRRRRHATGPIPKQRLINISSHY